MKNLYALVEEKEYFVVTSNRDDHFSLAVFAPERAFEMEEKLQNTVVPAIAMGATYHNPETMIHKAESETDGKVPVETMVKCP